MIFCFAECPTRALSHILLNKRDLEIAVAKLNHKLYFTNILPIFMWDFFLYLFSFPLFPCYFLPYAKHAKVVIRYWRNTALC